MADGIMKQITECLDSKKNFLLSGGAGSGKTYTLIQTLNHVFEKDPKVSVACITYTNVAANEIRERSPYKKLHVATIHDFLWAEIKEYQKNLKKTVLTLISIEKESIGNGLKYSGEEEINDQSFSHVEYRNYRDLAQGIISHDDLLKVANHMFEQYPLLSKILCDKYDYIFIDEYQDTQKSIIELFLLHIKKFAKDVLCVGFFGDKMQSIYETGIGNIEYYINSGDVREIIKDDNYRCSKNVIEVLNNIRSDIKQKPAKKNKNGDIENKTGCALFVHSNNDFELSAFKKSKFASGWNFDDPQKTKILFLTHKLSAIRLGFAELLSSYKYADNLIGNDPDCLARNLLKIGGILFHYEKKNFAYVISEIHRRIRTNSDKQQISTILTNLSDNIKNMTIEKLINKFNKERLVCKDDRFDEYTEKYAEMYEIIKNLPASQVMAYFEYYNNFSPYSTQHGIKGAEFNNVLVVMDNGKWNNYNFKYYFEKTLGKESVIQRTERIFYVCCSRAKENLVVYYPSATPEIIAQAQILFGEENALPLINQEI